MRHDSIVNELVECEFFNLMIRRFEIIIKAGGT